MSASVSPIVSRLPTAVAAFWTGLERHAAAGPRRPRHAQRAETDAKAVDRGRASRLAVRISHLAALRWRQYIRQSHDHSSHIWCTVRKIQLKDAKAKLSTVVDEAVRGKPSVITRHGKREAVVLSYSDWERLSRVPSFGRLLMSAPLEVSDLPRRSKTPARFADL